MILAYVSNLGYIYVTGGPYATERNAWRLHSLSADVLILYIAIWV